MNKPKALYLREMIEERCSREFAVWYARTGKQGWYMQIYNQPVQYIGRSFGQAKHLIMTTPLWSWLKEEK